VKKLLFLIPAILIGCSNKKIDKYDGYDPEKVIINGTGHYERERRVYEHEGANRNYVNINGINYNKENEFVWMKKRNETIEYYRREAIKKGFNIDWFVDKMYDEADYFISQ
jgi:hypothetical protein